MSAETEIFYCLIVQLLTTFVVGIWLAKRRSIGLPLAYLVNMLVLHGGAFVYLSPSYYQSDYIRSFRLEEYTVARGYVMTCIGCVAFAVGVLLADFFSGKKKAAPGKGNSIPAMKCAHLLMIVGAIALAALKLQLVPPGFQALFLVGRNAAVVGLCIAILYNLRTRNAKAAFLYFCLFLLLPAFYAIFLGFLSYGTQFVIILISMLLMQVRPNAKNIFAVTIASVIAGYAFISVFVIYMDNRQYLREILWSNADIGERLGAFFKVVDKVEPFDFENSVHMGNIDARLNQNIFVGKAIDHLDRHPERFANGRTIGYALLSWVPRFIWKDKPTTGSTAILTEFMGKRFDESTAMQSGQVFEFFINFGWLGVAIGMAIYGWFVRIIDVRGVDAYQVKNYVVMAKYFLFGIVLVWPGDMLASQFTAVAATIVFHVFMRKVYELQIFNLKDEHDDAKPRQLVEPTYTRY